MLEGEVCGMIKGDAMRWWLGSANEKRVQIDNNLIAETILRANNH
jgi:hypothetical protein